MKKLIGTVPIRFLCTEFSVAPSSFYYWIKGLGLKKFESKSKICSEIKKVFELSKSTYGSPRIFEELKSKGFKVSENTIARYMHEMGLNARLKKKYRVQTTDSNHSNPIASRVFKVEEGKLPLSSGKLLAGDITYLRLGNRFIYLSVVMDLFNREIVGWSMGKTLEKSLVLKALENSMIKASPDAEVIFHSDRGSQYASEAYRNLLKEKNIIPSMSRKGNCYDNSYVESWFGSLKKEWIYRSNYSTEKLKLRMS
jgi:transposase InsO family protein